MSNEYFDEEYQEVKKKVDIKEALTYMFKDGNASKFLGGAFIWALVITINFCATMNIMQAQNISLQKIIGFLGLTVINIIVGVVIPGFVFLYQHDRALNKNAHMRDWSGNLLNSFLNLVKVSVALILYYIIIAILLVICGIVFGALSAINPILGAIIGVLLFIAGIGLWIFSIVLTFHLVPLFTRDLKFSSLFKWGEAFEFCSGVHYGAGSILLAILMFIIIILFFVLGIGVTSLFLPTPLASGITIFLGYFLWFYSFCYMASVFGQFTYNAIEKNMRVKPETLPKEIHKDKGAIVFALIVYVIIMLISSIATLAMPSINKKQSDTLSTVKMKKNAADYEMVVSSYMEQYEVNDLSNMMSENCKNANVYFYVTKQNGCEFITQDGTYWKFNSYDGSAVVKDDIYNPKYSINMGLCSDGTINCPEEYPQAAALGNKKSKY